MKTDFKLAVAGALLGAALNQASANLIVNGDFEAGNSGFTSQYYYDASNNGLANGAGTVSPEADGSGKYAVGTSAKFFHSAFTTAGDHTSGAGKMMVVNGSVVSGKTVWSTVVTPPLTIGDTYELSLWAMNVYPDSPANLNISFGGNVLGSFSPIGNAAWTKFTKMFVATSDQSNGLIDLNVDSFGNDFALDDISLVAVPEPTTMIAGTLLLLPFAASTLRCLRRRSPAT
jgi:hypothetical protein